MMRGNLLKGVAAVALLAFVAAGCAMLQAKGTEQMLSAAGFQRKIADTPEKLAHLQTLTQYKLVPHTRDGQTYYVYADAKNKSLYVGDEAAYQEYQKLALQKKIADEQVQAAEMNQDAAMNWGMWGDWGPGPW